MSVVILDQPNITVKIEEKSSGWDDDVSLESFLTFDPIKQPSYVSTVKQNCVNYQIIPTQSPFYELFIKLKDIKSVDYIHKIVQDIDADIWNSPESTTFSSVIIDSNPKCIKQLFEVAPLDIFMYTINKQLYLASSNTKVFDIIDELKLNDIKPNSKTFENIAFYLANAQLPFADIITALYSINERWTIPTAMYIILAKSIDNLESEVQNWINNHDAIFNDPYLTIVYNLYLSSLINQPISYTNRQKMEMLKHADKITKFNTVLYLFNHSMGIANQSTYEICMMNALALQDIDTAFDYYEQAQALIHSQYPPDIRYKLFAGLIMMLKYKHAISLLVEFSKENLIPPVMPCIRLINAIIQGDQDMTQITQCIHRLNMNDDLKDKINLLIVRKLIYMDKIHARRVYNWMVSAKIPINSLVNEILGERKLCLPGPVG
ncbi:hypothetical protein HDV02_004381 [Globomyces sp. JEL0801]|nr:hypothetical protein HDV02_004381 [Globomyces sp. JEL0801]